ncbi:hypothetical protein Tco_1177293 [Tanacetum coccineum]
MAKSSNPKQSTPPQQQQGQPQDPGTPIPYDPALHVDYDPSLIHFKYNNEVALLYLKHPNKEHFKIVSDFISKCCLREAFTRTPTQYKEYLAEFWYTAKVVDKTNRVWFIIPIWAPNSSSYIKKKVPQGKQPGAKTGRRKKSTSLTTKHNPMSKKEATKGRSSLKEPTESPTSHSKIKKKSSLAKDSNPSQPLASAPVVVGIHKEDLQATSGPTSLGVTGEERANPQLSIVQSASHTKPIYSASTIIQFTSASGHDASADSTTETDKTKIARDGLETTHTKIGTDKEAIKAKKEVSFDQDEFNISPNLSTFDDDTKEIKLEDLSKLVKDVDVDLMDLDSPEDKEPIINYKLEKAKADAEAEATLLKAQPSYPNVEQLTELLVQSLKRELSKLLTDNDFSTSIPKELKELPTKFSEIYREINDLKRYVEELEIKLPRDLKEIPTKLEEFQSTISSLTKQVVELNKLKLQVPAGLLALPGQVSSITALLSKLKTLDPLLRGKTVIMTEEQINEQKKIKQSVKDDMAKKEMELEKEELVDLVGIDVVKNMYKANTRMENLHKTKLELEIDFSKPLGEQDPIIKLNDLAKKKRKHADDIYEYFESTKNYKSSDFVSIEDFRELTNEMLYTIQEIFFRLHQGSGINDLARTFSTFLVAEVEKRNLNPSKQMRLIEQLRQ